MEKVWLKYFIDVLMALSFLVVTITGILKWPGLSRTIFAFTYEFISPFKMARLHDWSGLVMAILVLVHLVLNWSWIKEMTKKIFRIKK